MRLVARQPLPLLVLGLVVGCSGRRDDLPQTYPVTGTLRFADRRPFLGGQLTLTSGSTQLTIAGQVGSDGAFSLETLKGTTKVAGAPEGTYQATFYPTIPHDRPSDLRPTALPEPIHVGPNENRLELSVDPPAP